MFIVLYIASHLLLIITLFYLFSPNFLSPSVCLDCLVPSYCVKFPERYGKQVFAFGSH